MIYAILIFVGLCIIYGIFTWDSDPDYDYDSSSSSSDKTTYINNDLWGIPRSISVKDNNSTEHYGPNSCGISLRKDNDELHFTTNGNRGRTHTDKDGTRHHYDENNMPIGTSKPNGSGGLDHYDRWGLPTGTSKPQK